MLKPIPKNAPDDKIQINVRVSPIIRNRFMDLVAFLNMNQNQLFEALVNQEWEQQDTYNIN